MKLEDEACVVRDGEVRPESLVDGVSVHPTVEEIVGFSVQSANGATVEELARAGGRPAS